MIERFRRWRRLVRIRRELRAIERDVRRMERELAATGAYCPECWCLRTPDAGACDSCKRAA